MAHRFRSGPVWETNPVRTLAAACAWMACALAAAGCASSNSLTGPTDRTTLAAGSWGGQHVGLTVTAAATTIEFDCAHGRIEGAIPLDARGRFDVSGTFVLEHGGPARPDEVADTRRARYVGSTAGSVMDLTVTITEPTGDVGTFSLALGQTGHFVKCL
jgi:hypothetical protein